MFSIVMLGIALTNFIVAWYLTFTEYGAYPPGEPSSIASTDTEE